MVLFEQEYDWTPADSSQDVPFSFDCPDSVREIRLHFIFSPGLEIADEICRPQVEKALTRYYDCYPRDLQPMDAQKFLPVKNLITLSLDKDGRYLGNAHRWAPDQAHILTETQTSLGFTPPDRLPGHWAGMLHLHEVISPACHGKLRIEGREAYEMVSG